MSSKTGVLEPLRVRVRRFQFIVGLGFFALVLGSVVSVSLTLRLSMRVQALPLGLLRILMVVALEQLWVLLVLPVLCYGAARVMELRPWHTAGGAAAAGAAFLLALSFVQNGVGGLWLGGLHSVLNVVAFAVGVVLSARAILLGRAAAAQQSVKAQEKAQERKSEYDEFLRAAEQGAARLEQREATAQSAASDATVKAEPPARPEASVTVEKAEASVAAETAEASVAAETAEASARSETPVAAEPARPVTDAAPVVSLPVPPLPEEKGPEPERTTPPDVPKTPAA